MKSKPQRYNMIGYQKPLDHPLKKGKVPPVKHPAKAEISRRKNLQEAQKIG